MKRLRFFFILALVLMLTAGLTASAFAAKKNVPKDVSYLLGLYNGNGSQFIIRENAGALELLFRTAGTNNDFTGANIYPLAKVHFDSYTIYEEGPLLSAEAGVRFERDSEGNGVTCKVGGGHYARIFFPGEGGKTQRLDIAKSDYESKKAAASAGSGAKGDLADIRSYVPNAKFDLRYATDNNIFGYPLYDDPGTAYLDKNAATALKKAADIMAAKGYGLVIWEAYRPLSVTNFAQDLLPKDRKNLLGPYGKGEDRNTGLAVDVSLYDLATGEAVTMISDFDEISPRQFPSFAGGTTRQRSLRDSLKDAMVLAGFTQGESEWWHFTFGDTKTAAKLDAPYQALK